MNFDYGIIGGGPAGYTAAMMLVQKGSSVILFEKDKLGGTCLNKGCIPTKSILHSSEIYNQILHVSDQGINVDINSFDFLKVVEKRDKTVEKIRKSLELALKNLGVSVVYSNAKIKNKNTIIADDKEYCVNNIIYACGAMPRELKGLEFDGKFILSSDDVLKLDKLPQKVLIVGSGAIGIEWARIFSNFGVEVTIVELADRLLPPADIDVSKRIERVFKQKKIKYFLNDSVENIENKVVRLKSGNIVEPDFILCAAGRVAIKPECDCAVIGDSSDEIQLAHYAIHQAKKLALGINYNKDLIPSVVYGEPEIAWVGLREQESSGDCKKVLLPITALGKSWCDDATEGFIKLIVKENKIVGAHIISKEAASILHQILIAMQNGVTIDKLKEVCFAHPTYSEGIFESIFRL